MKNYKYIIMAAVLASAVSCNESLIPDPVEDSGTPIRFSAGLITRAFLGSDDINTANTRLTIYGLENKAPFIEGGTATYNAAESSWELGDEYYWGRNKTYKFFSYLSKDKNGNTAPAGISVQDSTLKVPSRTFDFAAADNNFDFCYSEAVNRPGDNADHSTVAFDLKHLYSAIAFSAHNYTGSSITIKEVSLFGLKNKKSATISFSDSARVTFPTDSASCTWLSGKKLNSANITIAKDATCANLVGDGTAAAQHYMFWPQDSTELKATGWTGSSAAPTGGAYVKVVYNQGGSDITRYAQFPQDNDGTKNLGWPAGTKRKMEISFRDNWVSLSMKASPWEFFEQTIKYHDEVDVESELQFDSNTCNIDAATHTVYFKGGNPITGSFKLNSPEGATWVISKEGDYDAFEVDVQPEGDYGDGVDCNSGPVDVSNGNTFTIYPMAVTSSEDYIIQISFSIRYPDGESTCIDDDIQPVKWTIIFTK